MQIGMLLYELHMIDRRQKVSVTPIAEVKKSKGLPWWLSGKASAWQLKERQYSSPDPGRSHMPRSNKACAPQLLSPSSRPQEPKLLSPHPLEPMFLGKGSYHSEKPAHCNKKKVLTAQKLNK